MGLGIPMAMLLSAGISTAGGIAGGMMNKGGGKGEDTNPWGEGELFRQLPDYPEAEGARKQWWSTLQDWQGKPGYGAIAPDWEDIWSRAKQKLSQYYWGGTMDTGLAGKVRASAARRNVSQSPALENMLTAMGMQEGQDIGNLAGMQAEKQAEFGERGRMNWLNSLMGLSGQKPSYVTRTGVAPGGGQEYGMGNMIGDVSSGVGDLFSQYAQNQWLQNLMKQSNQGQYTPSGLSSWMGSASPVTGRDPGFRIDPSLYQ